MKLYISIIVLLLSLASVMPPCAVAQSGPADSAGRQVFSLIDLQEIVMNNHPVVKQAGLLSDAAQARIMQALGKFDPKLESHFARKQFGNVEYYNNWQTQLKVPLWLAGADLKIGYDRNFGEYTNPQYYTGRDGLTGIGLSIPIGQGLLIDERRNTLRQARAMARYAEADQVKQILTIWLNAVKVYWDWYFAYSQYQLYYNGVNLADARYKAIVQQVALGDKPAVDSVEASITVQDRRIQLTKAEVELRNTALILSNYLWNEHAEPLEMPGYAVPESIDTTYSDVDKIEIPSLVDYAQHKHPEILKLQSKGEQLDAEVAYRKEMLKLRLDLNGSLITRRNTFGSYHPEYYDFGFKNYKVSVDFSFPLFLRAERGKLNEARIKRQDLELDLFQMNRTIYNDILTSYNSIVGYKMQIKQQEDNLASQQVLLKAELQKFSLGESTLFLINSRETKLIDMEVKKQGTIAGYHQKIAELYYKSGTRQEVAQR